MKKILTIVLITGIIASGCKKDFLDVDPTAITFDQLKNKAGVRQLLTAADDRTLVGIGIAVDDAEDFQHRIGKIGIPAAGTEADLAKDLAMPEAAAAEGF